MQQSTWKIYSQTNPIYRADWSRLSRHIRNATQVDSIIGIRTKQSSSAHTSQDGQAVIVTKEALVDVVHSNETTAVATAQLAQFTSDQQQPEDILNNAMQDVSISNDQPLNVADHLSVQGAFTMPRLQYNTNSRTFVKQVQQTMYLL